MFFTQFRSSVAVALLSVAPIGAFANHVDFFENGAFNLTNNTSSTQMGLPTGTILGGQRATTLTRTAGNNGSGGNAGSVFASLIEGTTGGTSDNNDVSVLFSGTGIGRGTLLFQYGLGGDLNANFLDIPSSVNDWNRLHLDFGAFSGASLNLTVSLFSREDGGLVSLTQTYTGAAGGFDFLYSAFNSGTGLSNAFLRNIDQVSLTLATNLSTTNNFGFELQSFNRNGSVAPAGTVPEPGSIALLGLGLAALSLVSRRRVKKSD